MTKAKTVYGWAPKWNGEIAPDWVRSTRRLLKQDMEMTGYAELSGPFRVEIRQVKSIPRAALAKAKEKAGK